MFTIPIGESHVRGAEDEKNCVPQAARASGCVASFYQQVTPADELILFAPHFLRMMAESWHNFPSARWLYFYFYRYGLWVKNKNSVRLINFDEQTLSLRKENK